MKFLNKYLFKVMFVLLLAVFASLVVESKIVYWEGCVWHFCGITGMAFMVFFGWCVLGSVLVLVRQVYWMLSVPATRLIKKGKHRSSRRRFPLVFSFRRELILEREYAFTESCLYDLGMPDQLDKNKLFGVSFCLFPRVRTQKWEKETRNTIVWFRVFGLVVIKPQHWSSASWTWNRVTSISPEGMQRAVSLYPFYHKDGIMHMMEPVAQVLGIGEAVYLTLAVDKRLGAVSFGFQAHSEEERIRTRIFNKLSRSVYGYLDLWFGGNRKAPQDIEILEERL